MNNLSMKIKKALSNKNVVTVLGFILIGVILIVAYNARLKSATTLVKVPYALVTIEPQTKIQPDMIGYVEVARHTITESYYTNSNLIIGKYTNLESTIYEGSFFYKAAIAEGDTLPTAPVLNIPEGETLSKINVNMESSYFNTLVPGDYFDLYVRTIGILPDEKKGKNEIIVGKLFEKIKILAVKSDDGKNVFSGNETRTPASVLFSLPEELYLLKIKAEYFSKLDGVEPIEFIIVPRGQKYVAQEGETIVPTITSDQLEEYINDKTKEIEVNEIKQNATKDE